eukprot:11186023-Lingulodinium_polyedra.AAC.1
MHYWDEHASRACFARNIICPINIVIRMETVTQMAPAQHTYLHYEKLEFTCRGAHHPGWPPG